MTLNEFNALDEGEKLDAILSTGELIATREITKFKVDLYDMFSFYAEMWSSPDETRCFTLQILC
jgi:hypothetical protein